MNASLRTVLLVARKELVESIRDRRTLFVALVLPVLVYPLVILGLGPVVSRQKRELAETPQKIALTGPDAAVAAAKVLVPYPSEEGAAPTMPALEVVATDDPAAALADREIQLWVEAPEGLDEALAAGSSATVTVRYDGSDDQSREARDKWSRAYEAAARRELDARLADEGLSAEWRNPLRQDLVDVASPEMTAASVYGRVLALLLVLMTLTSSFYPAVDAVAGEKERGTMETLLVAPCRRTHLVLGKFLAVLAVTLAAALLNLTSFALTTGPFLSALGPDRAPALEVTWSVFLGILVLLVPLAAVFSAVALALSTLARSVKEAQHYLSPLVILVMPMAMVVIVPNVPLTRTLASVPVTNAVLFFRDLMVGRTEWATALVVLGSTVAYAGLAIWASVLLFLREETLFRGPEGAGSPLRRPRPRALPTAPSAVFLFAASLAALWYCQGILPKDIVGNLLVTQLAVVLAPCLALAWWMRVDVRSTFRLAPPRPRQWAAVALALPLGLVLPILSEAIQRWVGGRPAPDSELHEMQRQMEVLVASSSPLRLVLLIGVLPAVCEELVHRGFNLSGLGQAWPGRRGRAAAVCVTAAFFALSHVFPEKWPNTFAMGVVLAWLALRTGSLLPGVVAHAVHNGAAVLAARTPDASWARFLYGGDDGRPRLAGAEAAAGPGTLRLGVAVGVVVLVLLVIHRLRADGAAAGGTAGGPDPGVARGT